MQVNLRLLNSVNIIPLVDLSKFGRRFLCAQKRLPISKTACILPRMNVWFIFFNYYYFHFKVFTCWTKVKRLTNHIYIYRLSISVYLIISNTCISAIISYLCVFDQQRTIQCDVIFGLRLKMTQQKSLIFQNYKGSTLVLPQRKKYSTD